VATRSRKGESKPERAKRLADTSGVAMYAQDYLRRYLEFRLGARKETPAEAGKGYTLSPKGAADLRALGAQLIEDDDARRNDGGG
jgi:hypothetical protein